MMREASLAFPRFSTVLMIVVCGLGMATLRGFAASLNGAESLLGRRWSFGYPFLCWLRRRRALICEKIVHERLEFRPA
jgi:hypothetical protein